MRRQKTLSVFNPEERERAHVLLATQVAFMMGRKFEEGDWSGVYCRAKGIPEQGWSNLNIDVMHNGLGVEHKMLRVPPDQPMYGYCGTRLMHPSATRSIRISSAEADANSVMIDVLTQYSELIEIRRAKVQEKSGGTRADLRTGWMLWQSSLREFLYFEEELQAPDPQEFFAEWHASGGGARKKSKNLWVYEKSTGDKRYSITTAAGAKIQPYFDVPPPNDPNLYVFRVQGEELQAGLVRIWIAASTARELERIVGSLNDDNLNVLIANAAAEQTEDDGKVVMAREEAIPVTLSSESYKLLVAMFPVAVSDEHMAQLLVHRLRK